MIHIGSNHRCVMAKFEIPVKTKRKTRHNTATAVEIEGDTAMEKLTDQTREKGCEARYEDIKQEVKDAEPVKEQKTAANKAAAAAAAIAAQMTEVATSEESEVTAAADGDASAKKGVEATEATVASEAEEIQDNDEEILALIHERRTIKKDEKERIREVSKKIIKCIRE